MNDKIIEELVENVPPPKHPITTTQATIYAIAAILIERPWLGWIVLIAAGYCLGVAVVDISMRILGATKGE